MNTISKLTRREFIKLAGLAAAALTFVSGCLIPRRADTKVLSDGETSLLEAIVEQIIPTDEWPGGRDAGVVNFIRTQLEGPYRRFQGDYRKGLAAITSTSLERYQKRFEALTWDQQTSFLQEMESGRLNDGPWKDGFSRRFFELLAQPFSAGILWKPPPWGE